MHIWALLAFLLCEQSVTIDVSPMTLSIFVEALARMTPSITRQACSRVFELVELVRRYAQLVAFGDFVLLTIVAPVILPGHILQVREKVSNMYIPL